MMTRTAACAYFGGDKPLHPSTLYRGIKADRYPKPVHIGPNTARWVRSECHVARQKLIEARDYGRTTTTAGANRKERAEPSTQHAEAQLSSKPRGVGAALAHLHDRSRAGRA